MELSGLDGLPVTLIGHPYASIGMGEQLRSHLRALRAVQVGAGVVDIFRHASREDTEHEALIESAERRDIPGGIRIFHVNGDEVERVLDAFEAMGGVLAEGTNVVVPAWELPRYPDVWARDLRRFDQVWALSTFIRDALGQAGIDAPVVGQSVECRPAPLLPRAWFGIRESAFAMLHFFDLTSYATRKNPGAVMAMLDHLGVIRPHADVQVVLKVKDGERDAPDWAAGLPNDPRLVVLSHRLDSAGVRSLIRACDAFVSLHRSEGFGRGLGEAMALGRLAIGTGWSGNCDFMTAENSRLVRHRLVRVGRDEYPQSQGQNWAEADAAHAADLVAPLIDDPWQVRTIAERGRREVLSSHGDRAIGIRLLDRLEALMTVRPVLAPAVPA